MMKFTVLLPTRNRLAYIQQAIESVLRQDYGHWEIIVSDNDSEEDVQGYVKSLQDPRIHYIRTPCFVSVTDNWNNTLKQATGEYIIMLGDDDCLMKNFFSTIKQLVEDYPNPDMIYMSGFLYAYPHVYPNYPQGFLKVFGNATFLERKKHPFWLDKKTVSKLVRDCFNFKVNFTYNMQYAVISSSFLFSLAPDRSFFQSPYPDYFGMIALLMKASRVLACPYPLITVGICPKSFGYYYYNNKEKEGIIALNNQQENPISKKIENLFLPGTNMNTSWLISLETLKVTFPKDSIKVNYSRYRKLQILQVIRDFIEHKKIEPLQSLWRLLSTKEKVFTAGPCIFIALVLQKFPSFFKRGYISFLHRIAHSHAAIETQVVPGNFLNITEVFTTVDPKLYIRHPSKSS